MLKITAAAKYCGISPASLRSYIKQGIGPRLWLTPKGHRRFREEDLREWLDHFAVNSPILQTQGEDA